MVAAVETMMYARQVPWHGLGKYVGDEDILSAQAIVESGLDWSVSMRDLFALKDGVAVPVEDFKAVVRDTDDKVFGAVGKNWTPIQNRDAFNFMDSLVGEGLMRYHTAGALSGGRRVWMLGKIGETEIVPKDKVDHYLFLYNGFDGKTALRCLWTNVRVVCANTAAAALQQGAKTGVSIRHTRNAALQLKEAHNVLGLANKAFDESNEFLRKLAETPMGTSDWVDLCLTLFPDPVVDEDGEVTKRGRTRVDNKRRELTSLFLDGTGASIPGVRGTAWGAYNAITEYASFFRSTRGSQDKRFESLMLGTGSNFVSKGTALLRQMAS
jgi:phage/plasmid-like protein (TIGR03299 family)